MPFFLDHKRGNGYNQENRTLGNRLCRRKFSETSEWLTGCAAVRHYCTHRVLRLRELERLEPPLAVGGATVRNENEAQLPLRHPLICGFLRGRWRSAMFGCRRLFVRPACP